ncbi:MAG: outer membrane protein assembly factor BamA [Deltaproteobacteria bacterium]|jgi:outer membrane protein insertion porin family|nr:outer membrane protein assembly factor BamA [Deltaproteobacteria bacterium]
MYRHLSLVIAALLFIFPDIAHSIDRVKVIILPFDIHASKDLSTLQNEILNVIKTYIKEEGAFIVTPESVPAMMLFKTFQRYDDIRKFGLKNGADDVVWGSLTLIGQKFSLDVKMIQSVGKDPPQIFIKEGQGLENLSGVVKQLARDIGMKLFKRVKVASVVITGNKRIESDAIKMIIKTKPGDIYLSKSLSDDLKAVFAMGYFDDIRIEAEDTPDGKKIIFTVEEKPTIRVIRFKGNKVFKEEKLKENLTIKTGSILNPFKIRSNIERIEELYKEKNYHNIKAAYNVKYLENNQADLEFDIDEGEKILIKSITFKGNNAYTDKILKNLIKTSEKGFFSWVTSSGDLKMEDLEQDVAKLSGFYYNNGYIQARIGEPQVEYKENWIYITIKIDEGPQFKVGNVDITGDLVLPKDELKKRLKITKETYYNREVVRNDVLALTDLYSDEGFAYADISPIIDKDFDNLKVNITYTIQKGNQVYFEYIIIGGNTKTRDKVIRRELNVYEQELYSGRKLKQSVRNLYRVDFFEDVKVNTVKGSADDQMILKIDVTEKPTGTMSFGAGYSSQESVFGSISVSQRNLFGRGQILNAEGQIGGRTNLFRLSFTEPWLFDIPLSMGVELYNWETDYDTYDRKSLGGGIRFSYPVYAYTRASIRYNYDDADITNISENAAKSIKDLAGTNITSSITTGINYDSTNRRFNPSEGSKHSVSLKYAGLGGNVGFTKVLAETGWFWPLVMDTVGFLHGEAGYVTENSGDILPDYERFYLGGINSVRGYEWREINVLDEDGNIIGGNKFVLFNAECIIPLLKQQGLVGVIFYDTGNVFNDDESIDLGTLRNSVGFGFRWYSPMGPIRFEYGYKLDVKEGEDSGGRWEFSMGSAF